MNKKVLSTLFIIGVTSVGLNVVFAQTPAVKSVSKPAVVKTVTVKPQPKVQTKAITVTTPQVAPSISVKPLDVVKNPSAYLHKRISMTSKFSKFSTLGLDYKPAFRSSENYITFLFLREDSEHKIPLSEMKIFLSRKIAEKLPDVKEGDMVHTTGTVFSNALGDVWIDADSFEVVNNK